MLALIPLAIAVLLLTAYVITDEEFLGVAGVIFGLFAVIFLMAWPICYYEDLAKVEKYKAFQQTIESARYEEDHQLENIRILKEITEKNEWLAYTKFWNDTLLLDWFIPDAIEQLEPIR